ncbi:hypothetical protein GCM10012288_10400 [Malaciobacter pacificus]|uniref:Uncharacterized protein n=1 Tax=Malaciobacter pacificus TaxID=1080223 RepID=A0A5C2H5W9_9BACT|nr:DUF309 domain-containing protein [Malaciobacter pacificus]QEP34347.1 hypothetical protein APAC_1228 [Malaciobacter pacificus]GGD38242.1 hypothetical protein GCM10012288_10400 [Malaciobacter pacificus]
MKIDYTIFTQKTAIDRFIFAIENGYYVEAHELLEDDWNMYKKQGEKEKALVLKGLINGATALALYHIKKRPHGFDKVWPAFIKYIPLLDEVNFEEKDKYYKAKEILLNLNSQI